MLDRRIHNVTRVTWTQLGVGMFGCEVIRNAFLQSTFELADTKNASLANLNPFTKEYETLIIRVLPLAARIDRSSPSICLLSFPDSTVCSS